MSAKTDREHADVTRNINTLCDRFTEAERLSAAAGAGYEMLFSNIGNEIEQLAVGHLETRAEVKGLATEMGQVASSGHTGPASVSQRTRISRVPCVHVGQEEARRGRLQDLRPVRSLPAAQAGCRLDEGGRAAVRP